MARAADPIVLFDLDGTITDSAPGVVGSFRAALEQHGVPVPGGDLTTRLVGPPMAVTMASLGLGPALERTLLDAYMAHYDAHGMHQATVFPGMAALLDDLSARPLRLAVTTSKQEPTARRVLEEKGLAHRFEVIAGAQGPRHAKADVVADALRRLGVSPGPGGPAIVLAGDRSHDVHGAARHGIPAAFVRWGYGTDAEAEGAAWVVDSPGALGRTLRRYLLERPAPGEPAAADPRLHITFVCTGNICRSPMAEKIVAARLAGAGLADRVRVTSAGTGDWHVGEPADTRARDELAAHGYPTAHRAAHVGPQHLGADLVVALDEGHRRALLAAGADPARVRLLRSFDPAAPGGAEVADPYYGGTDGFAQVRRQIEAAADGIVAWTRGAVDAHGAGEGAATAAGRRL